MEEISIKQSNPGHRSRLIDAIKDRLTDEFKIDHFLQRLFDDKFFINDLLPGQVPDLPFSELDFDHFHVECIDEICELENLRWILPVKLLVHEPGKETSVHFNSRGELIGFIAKIKYKIESNQDTNEHVPTILEFEITKPIPIMIG